MKPVYQTKYGEGEGNCFQACLASIFELELEDVPDFCNVYPTKDNTWFNEYTKWLNGKGYSVLTFSLLENSSISLNGPQLRGCILLVSGKNKNKVQHCTIYRDGECIHNPNKNCTGIVPEYVDIIFPLNPSEKAEHLAEVEK